MVSLLGFSSVALLGVADWFSLPWSKKPIIIISPFISVTFFVYGGTSCRSLLFIMSSIPYSIFIISVCHNLPVVALSAMGMWSKSSKRGVVCAQTELKWVAVGLVLTPLFRTLGPSTTRGSPTQHCKKCPLYLEHSIEKKKKYIYIYIY